ncbi:MAG: holo-ACP synthase [Deltaproteobacteria bacterium]|nr:holo-ACP synthase [Deltaproteobacteria bacterium]
MIYGIGIDIVHIPKFKKAVERWGNRFKNRIFTQNELLYCEKRRFSEQHLAVRFAAKEAFLKALGERKKFSEIEVANNSDGKPCIKISACKLRTSLTLSHDGEYCIAQVILETEREAAEGVNQQAIL